MDHGEAPKLLCCNNICTIVHCCNGEALNFYLVTTYAPLSLPSHYILVLPKPSFSTKQRFFWHKVFLHNWFCNSTPPIVEIMMICLSSFQISLSLYQVYIKMSTSFYLRFPLFVLPRFPSPSIKYIYQDFHLFLSEISTLHPSEISLSVYLRFPPAYLSEDLF